MAGVEQNCPIKRHIKKLYIAYIAQYSQFSQT